MSGKALQSLARHAASRKAPPARVARSVERMGRQKLIERRDHCLSEIAQLRNEMKASSSLAFKARRLLTQYWAAAAWCARADILRTAEWLVGIDRKRMPSDGTYSRATDQPHHVDHQPLDARARMV
jgi:hypothetical protein